MRPPSAQAAALAAMEVEWDEEADRSFARKLEQRERGKAAEMSEAAELEEGGLGRQDVARDLVLVEDALVAQVPVRDDLPQIFKDSRCGSSE